MTSHDHRKIREVLIADLQKLATSSTSDAASLVGSPRLDHRSVVHYRGTRDLAMAAMIRRMAAAAEHEALIATSLGIAGKAGRSAAAANIGRHKRVSGQARTGA
jgi:hypothetical protein